MSNEHQCMCNSCKCEYYRKTRSADVSSVKQHSDNNRRFDILFSDGSEKEFCIDSINKYAIYAGNEIAISKDVITLIEV